MDLFSTAACAGTEDEALDVPGAGSPGRPMITHLTYCPTWNSLVRSVMTSGFEVRSLGFFSDCDKRSEACVLIVLDQKHAEERML
jgi:hypothetical protein